MTTWTRTCLAAVLAAGCSFEVPGANLAGDGGPTDGPADTSLPTDARPDAGQPADGDGDTIVDPDDNCPGTPNTDQRDHDLDTRGDACDECPHLASTTVIDADGDGLGDACDPRPAEAGDTVAVWDGFYADSPALSWTKTGTWSLENGALRQVGTGTTFIAAPPDLPRAFVQIAAHIDAVNGMSQTLGVFAGDPLDNFQSYGCLAARDNQAQTIGAYSNWFGVAPAYTTKAWTGAIAANRDFELQLLLADQNACLVRQGANEETDTEQVGPTTGKAGIYLDDVSVRIDYLFVALVGA